MVAPYGRTVAQSHNVRQSRTRTPALIFVLYNTKCTHAIIDYNPIIRRLQGAYACLTQLLIIQLNTRETVIFVSPSATIASTVEVTVSLQSWTHSRQIF